MPSSCWMVTGSLFILSMSSTRVVEVCSSFCSVILYIAAANTLNVTALAPLSPRLHCLLTDQPLGFCLGRDDDLSSHSMEYSFMVDRS